MFLWLALASAVVVHFVPHSHVDLGWLKTIDEYYYGCDNNYQFESVRTTLSSVAGSLLLDSRRRFVFAEVAFFKQWWEHQTPELKAKFRSLVASGQFEFVSGGWSSPDEACTEYYDLIENLVIGHDFLSKEFGVTPTISWQIDPFGHSAQYAELLSKMGFTAAVVNRVHYEDKHRRKAEGRMEFMWQPFNLTDSRIFTHILYNHYSSPPNIHFSSPYRTVPFHDYICKNSDDYAIRLLSYVIKMKEAYPTDQLLIPMGDDFEYWNAELTYQSIDGLRDYVNRNPEFGIQVRYSTLSEYFEAVRSKQPVLEVKVDDFFPYASSNYSYWTGFYTSRSWIKQTHKQAVVLLRAASRAFTFRAVRYDFFDAQIYHGIHILQKLRDAVGIMTHHDAVTGTSRMRVNQDYLNRVERASVPVRNLLHALSTTQPESCETDTCQSPYKIVTISNNSLRTRKHVIELSIDVPYAYVTDSHSVVQDCEVYKERLSSTIYMLACAVVLGPMESVLMKVYENELDSLFYEAYDGQPLSNAEYSLTWDNGLINLTHHNQTLTINYTYQVYYASTGDTFDTQSSGAYVFRPTGPSKTHCEFSQAKVMRGRLLEKLWIKCGTSIETVITLKRNCDDVWPNVIHFVKGIWGNVGKEIVVVYGTSLEAEDFTTDTNSLRNLTRTMNFKHDFKFEPLEAEPGNYYPVTSYIYVTDNSTGQVFAMLPDRTQGATARGGAVEVMLHRVTLQDDGKGLVEIMNERDPEGSPIKVLTEHRLVFGTDLNEIHRAEQEIDEPSFIFFGFPTNSYTPVTETLLNEFPDCRVDLNMKGLKAFTLRTTCREIADLVNTLLPSTCHTITELSLNEQQTSSSASQKREDWLWGDNTGERDEGGVRVYRVEW